MGNSGIGVVIVTFNRIEKLKVALECFEKQSSLPMYIIVVDNASTDGTDIFLSNWQYEQGLYERIVLRLPTNIGGSGGFYSGLEKAQSLGADWIWVSDDDAYPDKEALKNMAVFIRNFNLCNEDSVSAICGMVIDRGKVAYSHRGSLIEKNGSVVSTISKKEDYCKEFFRINTFSYVGTVISRKKLAQVGLPNKKFFIYCDDTEHSIRLSQAGDIICVPKVVVYHDTNATVDDYGWREYYSNRNYLYMLKQHFSQDIFEQVVRKMKRKFLLKRLTLRFNEKYKMREAAMNDAIEGKLGIHPVYRPGWKPSK